MSRKFAGLASCVLVATTLLVLGTGAPVSASTATITFQSHNRGPVSDGISVQGKARFQVSELTKKYDRPGRGVPSYDMWCVQVDGVPVAPPNGQAFRDVHGDVYISFEYGIVSRTVNRQVQPGCWTSPATDPMDKYVGAYSIDFTINTTLWPEGQHTISVLATRSDGIVETASLRANFSNPGPSAQWATTDGSVFSVATEIEALISSVAEARQLCLLRDGRPANDITWGKSRSSTGCWAVRFTGSEETRFTIDPVGWADGPGSLELRLTDINGQSTSAFLQYTVSKVAASSVIEGISSNEIVTGARTIKFTPTLDASQQGRVDIEATCIQLDGSLCLPTKSTGTGDSCYACTPTPSTHQISLNSAALRDGPHQFIFSFTDSFDRTTSTSVNFVVANGLPQLGQPGAMGMIEYFLSTRPQIRVQVPVVRAQKVFLAYGTGGKTNNLVEVDLSNISADAAQTLVADNLKARTRYTLKVVAMNANGMVESKKFTVTTPSMPRSTGGGSVSSGGGGGGAQTGVFCPPGTNLERCEDLNNKGLAERLPTIDCTGAGRSVLWARNWWIRGVSGGRYVISKDRSRCK